MILYFYWNWGDNKQDTSITSSTADSADSQIKEPVKENIQQNDNEQKQTIRQYSVTESYQTNSDNEPYPEKAEPIPDPQAFSERMRQYQLRLSREERERLSNYDKALQARNRTR